jgi:murein DD-endopeptidase MepM/ murein hydrolase activator NlpD
MPAGGGSTNYRRLARQYAQQYGLPADVFERQIQQESGFNPTVTSKAGAIGIAQIMPATARGWGVDPRDPNAALRAAAKNMASYARKYGGMRNALIAYNAGPGAVGRANLPAETQNYIKTILGGSNPKLSNVTATAAASAPTASSDASSGISNLIDVIQRLNESRQPTSDSGASSLQSMNDQIAAQQAQSLEMIKQLGQPQSAPTADAASTGGGADVGDARMWGRGYASPERAKSLGKIIGTPHSGTHTLGNWQSDNAVDIAMPTGTIVQSMQDGVVEKVKGGYHGGQDRFDGYQVTVRFKDGNRAFYTHLSKAGVKPGQKIRAGQALGRSGAANGVQHLHLGVEHGSPPGLRRRR